jgi:hypothetical protein
VLVNSVLGDIGANIRAGGEDSRLDFAVLDYLQQRAGPGIALAEQKEVERLRFREYGEVRLDMSWREPAGGLDKSIFTDKLSKL